MRLISILALCAGLLGSCGRADQQIMVASTTSLHDTGLLDSLIAAYRVKHPNVRVMTLAVGSGEALELGRRGDADVLLVHSPDAERRFMEDGYGTTRHEIMQNDFVLVGDSLDPAGIRSAPDAAAAFRRIAESTAPFVSRGDESGTHVKERAIWTAAGTDPGTLPTARYVSVGQGMTETLRVADERRAYTLTDLSTFTTLSASLGLTLLYRGDPMLRNIYSVIAVRNRGTGKPAQDFAEFLRSQDGIRIIGEYGSARYGRPLFEPLSE